MKDILNKRDTKIQTAIKKYNYFDTINNLIVNLNNGHRFIDLFIY